MENLNEIKFRLKSNDFDSSALQKQEPSDAKSIKSVSIDNPTVTVIDQFKKFFEEYENVKPYIKIDETTKSYIENKRDWITRLEQEEFPVAFLGSFSAGKSTIINAIFKTEILPEGVDSTTAFPTIIRKGEVDRAVVYYINEDAKNILWNDLCTHIERKIDKNLGVMPQEDRVTHLERIKKEISEYETNIKKIDSKPLETLKKLLNGWSSEKYKNLKTNIQIDELMNYVEGYEDALFIDRIEVELKNINIPSHVVIVDLPGLAVANQRHIQFTKQYIQNKAKAFVVCMKPKSLLEGEEIEFLEEIYRVNSTILQRSFWVINQWETLNDQQKEEENKNFYKKIKEYNFSIIEERFFKFTALNYLYLSCKANGTLSHTKKLQKHTSSYLRSLTQNDLDNLSEEDAKKILNNHEEIYSFYNFVKILFAYLDTVAKDEFIKNAKSELLQEVLRLQGLLMPDYEMYSNKDNLESEIHSVEINKQLNAFIETLEEKVRQFATRVRTAGKSDLWKEANTVQVENEIVERISQLNREVKNKLQSGSDNNGILSRLPSEVEDKVKLNLLIRDKLVLAVEDFFLHRLARLLLELQEVNKDYLPEAMLKVLEDKLGKRDIAMRLNGLADALLFHYGDELDRIGLSLKECQGDTFEKRISSALETYKSELTKFMRSLVDDLNKYVGRSVKNHTEYIEEELLKLLTDERERIIIQIAHKINLSEVVKFEQTKQNIIKTSYDALTDLKKQL